MLFFETLIVSVPALRSCSLVFLLLHVLARHPLPPLCQTLASGAVFPCSEAAAMVARVAFWRVKDKKNKNVTTLTEEQLRNEGVGKTNKPAAVFTNFNLFNQFNSNLLTGQPITHRPRGGRVRSRV